MLTIFSVSYLCSMLLGTEVRATSLKMKPPQFPWSLKSKPPESVEEALDWLVVQQRRIAYGYSLQQVEELYKLKRSDVTERLTTLVPMTGDSVQSSPLGTHPERVVPTNWIPAMEHFDRPFPLILTGGKDRPAPQK